MLTAARLKELLEYDPETGIFTNKVTRSSSAIAGKKTGCADKHGHINIGIEYRLYKAHRLAWLYVYGEWPCGIIDHINRNPADNRLCNLRLADKSINAHNTGNRADNISGAKGVSWHKAAKKWRAYYTDRGETVHLGLFDTFDEAKARRAEVARLTEVMLTIQSSA